MHITVTEDYRIRYNGDPLPGDHVTGKSGDGRVVISAWQEEGRWIVLTVSELMVDRRAYLRPDFDGTTPYVVCGEQSELDASDTAHLVSSLPVTKHTDSAAP